MDQHPDLTVAAWAVFIGAAVCGVTYYAVVPALVVAGVLP